MAYAHRSLIVGTSLLVAVLLGSYASSYAEAAEQGITGKKLLLKSNPKMVLLSKDVLVIPGVNGSASDPRCVPDGGGLGGSVRLDDGTNIVTLSMPCANWSANGSGTLYQYKDASGVPKVAKIKEGLLKVVSPAGMDGFPVPSGAATVGVAVTVGEDKYCMSFTGTGDGSKFLVKDAMAVTCPPPCTGQLIGSLCWFLGADGESCAATCAGLGKLCDQAGTASAGSDGTGAVCAVVLDGLNISNMIGFSDQGCIDGLGCGYQPAVPQRLRCATPQTGCSDSYVDVQRACVCQ